mmetsp:Transcript_29516/g.33490  ORF Transcript_29516/g.33490 Transcript_29516/m.33490 type:complete len:203 (+) Transcript_29516:243-851(+)
MEILFHTPQIVRQNDQFQILRIYFLYLSTRIYLSNLIFDVIFLPSLQLLYLLDDDDVVVDDDNCDVDDIDNNIDAMDDIDVDDDNDNDDLDDTTMTTSLRLDHNQEKQQLGINSGTCIICIEDFVTNDVIVWSEDPSCSHIYHKTCMVQYLSSNAKLTTKQTRLSSNLTSIPILDVTTNPCPTCRRQKFCSIRDEDILQHYS